VAAAGNDGQDDDGDVASPGSVTLAISVGATQQSGEIWENSSVGGPTTRTGDLRLSPHQKPEIVAPGQRIISTGGSNLWYSSSGTSDSTVFVAGALALILEANPHLKSQPEGNASCLIDVKEALKQSALSNDASGHDEYFGYGFLDAKAWMEQSRLISDC
jgi:serine protease AprX